MRASGRTRCRWLPRHVTDSLPADRVGEPALVDAPVVTDRLAFATLLIAQVIKEAFHCTVFGQVVEVILGEWACRIDFRHERCESLGEPPPNSVRRARFGERDDLGLSRTPLSSIAARFPDRPASSNRRRAGYGLCR